MVRRGRTRSLMRFTVPFGTGSNESREKVRDSWRAGNLGVELRLVDVLAGRAAGIPRRRPRRGRPTFSRRTSEPQILVATQSQDGYRFLACPLLLPSRRPPSSAPSAVRGTPSGQVGGSFTAASTGSG